MIDLAKPKKQCFFISKVFQTGNDHTNKASTIKDERVSSALKLIPKYQYSGITEKGFAFIKQAIVTVENNLSNNAFNHNLLAFELNLSKSTLYRKIKTLTDLSIIEFVFYIRMNKALTLLEIENCSVSEVAYLVGYSDPKYFSKCFKAKFGMSPLNYKGLLRK